MNLEREIREAVERQYSFSAETWRAFATELLAEVDRLRAALGDGWVSVEERLPESDNVQVMVLAFHPTCNVAPFYAFAYYKRETGLFCAGGGGVYGNLTHWRPLPPLPAAEVEE